MVVLICVLEESTPWSRLYRSVEARKCSWYYYFGLHFAPLQTFESISHRSMEKTKFVTNAAWSISWAKLIMIRCCHTASYALVRHSCSEDANKSLENYVCQQPTASIIIYIWNLHKWSDGGKNVALLDERNRSKCGREQKCESYYVLRVIITLIII